MTHRTASNGGASPRPLTSATSGRSKQPFGRTIALLAQLVLGLVLLVTPGVVAATSGDPATSAPVETASTVTTGDPPADDSDAVAITTDATGTDTSADTSADTVADTSADTVADSATDTTSAGSGSSGGSVVTVTGPAVSTRYGNFQVQITVDDGVLTDVAVLQQPSDPKSQQINSRALPTYGEAALAAQSADFDNVSGATITWGAYTQSLQAALDEAGV